MMKKSDLKIDLLFGARIAAGVIVFPFACLAVVVIFLIATCGEMVDWCVDRMRTR